MTVGVPEACEEAKLGEVLQIVTQRMSSCRLMVDEGRDEWVSAKAGLILYVSFVNSKGESESLTAARLDRAVKSLMTSRLATSSGWKADHSDAESVSALASQGEVHVVIVPQATLAGRVKPGDKYLKYHRQIEKEKGFQLYLCFVNSILGFFKKPSVSGMDGNSFSDGSLNVHWGTYGKRQGLEFVSTGPSTHYFEF